MNNMKKIGLTALAGSLVATSAFAGAMSVSGSAKVTYQSKKNLITHYLCCFWIWKNFLNYLSHFGFGQHENGI